MLKCIIFLKISNPFSKIFFKYVFLYPTEKREGAWSLREMGSTWVGGTGEGKALQAGLQDNQLSPAEEGATSS
jgi:hypothetical protein